ncbi:TPA: restriction endonuclease subunit S [Citrobacter freundii]|uniref:restriction endonuclease subunit S n=1 Tax=Citrobacter freundii TaxID=546 RepID=UPI001ECEF480|nr:restriction endonuclease subunit S [Citrobacter freundii]EGT0632993.1 restriction endonuclease subunit S [Citrobacter freundii]MDK8078731.1 restriction endonuclease subunit S [Citrobacter freundii]MDK8590338.1 restriction endonuclease subunit S [Citrobacter freundii]HCJ7743116.1 restriction endonuclease subunit S [Citrobacter freundii]
MSNQINATLGDLVQAGGGIIHTGPFGSQLHAADYVSEGIPCIMPANMKDNRVDLSKIAFISEGDAQRLSKYLVREGDIVYSRRGDVTLKALIGPREAGYFCGTGCLLLRPGDKLDPDYLTYYLSTPKIQSWIISQAVGATMPNLNTGILSRIPFTGPEKATQKKISAILRTIDDKIAVNSQINAELESMAKTLYDYWFVQFDFPDTNGKPYKTSGGKMVYNATLKREIPAGWSSVALSKVTSITNQSLSPADYPDKIFNYYSIPTYDLSNSFGYEYGGNIGSSKFIVSENDILVSKLNPWFNRVIYTCFDGDAICSTEFVVWRTPNVLMKNFLYMIATSSQFIAHCTQSATGTSNSHKRVNPDIMMRYEISFDSNIAESLGEKLDPFVKKLIINQQENAKLIAIRDWLLPLLMNGQVTVK